MCAIGPPKEVTPSLRNVTNTSNGRPGAGLIGATVSRIARPRPAIKAEALEAERRAYRRTGKVDVLQQPVVFHVVKDVAVRADQLAPLERVADAGERLRGELGGAGACVDVVGKEPGAVAEPEAPAQPHDHVPQVLPLRDAARLRERLAVRSAERRAELPVARRL